MILTLTLTPNVSALTEIFDKADTSNTGKLTIPEYLELCRNYNIEVTEDDLETITSMAETNGGELSKNDFIIFVRQTNMYAHFDTVDPESDQHWENMIKHAWKMFDKVSRYLQSPAHQQPIHILLI